MRTERPGGSGRKRRGAALVLVLIFAVGVLMATTTLLALTDRSTRASAEQDRRRQLQAVLKAGIAAALNEMNRAAREPGWDPGKDGVGAITRVGPTGANDGVPVTTTDDLGRTIELGRYRATVRQEPTPDGGARKVLTVVAAWPALDAPDDRRLLLGAEVELREATLLETPEVDGVPRAPAATPLQLRGEVLPLSFSLKLGGSDPAAVSFNVSGIDENPSGHPDPQPADAPAASVDSLLLDEFIAVFLAGADSFVGDDPDNPGSPTSGLSAILGGGSSSVINEETLANARAAFTQQVDEVVQLLRDHGLVLGGPGGSFTLADHTYELLDVATIQGTLKTEPPLVLSAGGTVVIPNNAVIKGNVSGSGTLIVKDGLQIEGQLDWDGEIIIAGFDPVSPASITNGASLTFAEGGALSVVNDGSLVLLGRDTAYTAAAGARTTVDGGLLLLAEEGTSATVEVGEGARTAVEGVWIIFAQTSEFFVHGGGHVLARSLNLIASGDLLRNQIAMEWLQGSGADLIYDNTQVQEALRRLYPRLGAVLDDGEDGAPSKVKVDYDSYWEAPPRSLLAAQQALIAGDPDAPFGLDHGQRDWGR